MALHIIPIKRAEAQRFVEENHRHLGKVTGAIYQLGVACTERDAVVGVAICGRPVARHLDDGLTIEVNRVATDGTRNASSMLYAAAWRAAKALGYRRVITYTLKNKESGASLRGAAYKIVGESPGNPWNNRSRPRVDLNPYQEKIRWEKTA